MPEKFIILDTNVIISAAVFASKTPVLCLKKCLTEGKLVFSEDILQEYIQTLSNKKFDKFISIEKRLTFLQKLIEAGTLITITQKVEICRDPKDNKYLELAASCNAFCIVTGDEDLLVLHPFGNIPVLKPVQFLNI